jgi:hypothetical protein
VAFAGGLEESSRMTPDAARTADATLVAAATPAPADAETAGPETRWRVGVGAGASWLPVQSGTTTALAELSAGVDRGPFSLRVSPRFQYFTVAEYPSPKLSVGYLAVEGAFRVTAWYAISAAPLIGYSHASAAPFCEDVCHENPFATGLTLGVTVSPATFVFGPDGAFEAGLHAVLFEYPGAGQEVYVGGYAALQWFFFTSE